jgi:hypothetical protein
MDKEIHMSKLLRSWLYVYYPSIFLIRTLMRNKTTLPNKTLYTNIDTQGSDFIMEQEL